jgi:hypothetical protein
VSGCFVVKCFQTAVGRGTPSHTTELCLNGRDVRTASVSGQWRASLCRAWYKDHSAECMQKCPLCRAEQCHCHPVKGSKKPALSQSWWLSQTQVTVFLCWWKFPSHQDMGGLHSTPGRSWGTPGPGDRNLKGFLGKRGLSWRDPRACGDRASCPLPAPVGRALLIWSRSGTPWARVAQLRLNFRPTLSLCRGQSLRTQGSSFNWRP